MSAEDLAEAVSVGNRLAAEFRSLFVKLPPTARSGLGLARLLSIDRGTATRLVAICAHEVEGVEVLLRAPGVRGLRQVLSAMQTNGSSRTSLATASAAVDRFERLVQEFGGSRSKLIERLTAARARSVEHDPAAHERLMLEHRKRLFEASAGTIGQRMDLWLICHVFRPTPGSPDLMDHAMLRGAFGYRARRDAPAYAMRSFGRNDGNAQVSGDGPKPGDRAYHALTTGPDGAIDERSLFRDFSTDPHPLVTSRGDGREALVVVDPERCREDQGVDFVVAQASMGNWRHPRLDDPPRHDVSTHIGVPCRRVVFDVFLHRSMARQSLASPRLYRTTPGVFHDLDAHWPDRLPYPPPLQLMAEQSPVGSKFYPRHAALLSAFFERMVWPPSDFVGYRLEVEYPLWSGLYCVMFDYAGTPADDADQRK